MELCHSIAQSYMRFLEEVYQKISSIDEEKYGSETIYPLLKQITFLHWDFWMENYSVVLCSGARSNDPAFLIWGTPNMVIPAEGIAKWDCETILKKSLCYAQHIAIQDWVSDVLAYMSTPTDTYHNIFKNLKHSIQLLLILKPFVDKGSAIVFPGYAFCRHHWREIYSEFEENSDRTIRDGGGKIEAVLKRIGLSPSRAILGFNMVQEAIFIKERLGYIPASADSKFLTLGTTCFNLGESPSFLRNWKEEYEYASKASIELITEIRRWGNQAIFLEHVCDLDREFDLSDGSTTNLEQIAQYLKDIKAERLRAHEKRRRLLAATDLIMGLASISVTPIGAIPLLRSAWELAQRSKSNSINCVAKDYACIVAL